MKHLPMPFSIPEYLTWVGEEYPNVKYERAMNVIALFEKRGVLQPAGIVDDGEVLYEPGPNADKPLLLLVKKEAMEDAT